ncbi:MAG: DUF3789 domain-containing protein [Clostridiales bacterium]|nr:DUF3789 domain-containing protein [Clostridiales bacterium]
MTVTAFILGAMFGGGCGVFVMALLQVNRDSHHHENE